MQTLSPDHEPDELLLDADIEVTDEMVDAGLEHLWMRDPDAGESAQTVSDIIRAMRQAQLRSHRVAEGPVEA